MLIGLGIREIVLIESLDLAFGPGLTVLTGETGAGKSIILDALGLATGGRGDAGLVRRGAAQASAVAIFAPSPDHAAWAYLDDKGLAHDRDEDLVLRRVLGADGRSRAFVNDQPTGIGVLRDLGTLLIETHGQNETVGLLDARTHRSLLDAFGGCEGEARGCLEAWSAWRATRQTLERLLNEHRESLRTTDELAGRLAELDRLASRPGEEAALAEERAMLGAAEKAIADIAAARDALDDDGVAGRLGQAFRALGRARERTLLAGVSAEANAPLRLQVAVAAVDRALIEVAEAAAAIDAAAEAFEFEPDRLEAAETRLFALRAMARKLDVAVDALPEARAGIAARLLAVEAVGEALAAAEAATTAARSAYEVAAGALTAVRRAAGDRLTRAVQAELAPLKLAGACFAVAIETLGDDRAGPLGVDRVEFQIATLDGAPFAALGAIASGGELARLALALKAALAGRTASPQPLMVFDEVDQGVGGAVADAVGQRLARLADTAQVLVVTHSPQVAARANAHWRVLKTGRAGREGARVEALGLAEREEEIARMLSGEHVTDAARAAARALMHA